MSYRKLFIKIIRYKRFYKFFISGSIATIVNIFSLYLLHGVFGIQVVLAASISFGLAYLVSFSLQKLWTFASSGVDGIAGQMFKYLLVGILGLVINALGIYVLVALLTVWYILAQMLLSLGLAFLNYFLYKIIFIKEDLEIKKTKKRSQIKKILITTGIYPPDLGGPANYSKILKDELPSLGYDIKIVSYGETSDNDEADEVYKISREQNVFARYFKYFLQVWRFAKWADLVYVQGPVSEGLPSYFACRLRRKKYILKVVGDFAWEQGQQRAQVKEMLDEFQNKNYSFKVELWRLIEVFVASGAYLVITPSEYLKKIVKGWGIEADSIKVIYNSVKNINLVRTKLELKSELVLPDKLIISASRLVPWKGFDILIDTIAEMNKKGENISLYIAGEGPDRDDLQEKIQDLELGAKVKLLGGLGQEKLWKYMKASDVFILNTAYEGLSHLLIEAMSLGLPIITTRVGGNPELIDNNENGILIDYNDKEQIIKSIKMLLNNRELTEKFSQNAKQTSRKFSKNEMLQNIDGLFRKI